MLSGWEHTSQALSSRFSATLHLDELIYTCPQTTFICFRKLLYVSCEYFHVCVLILLYMCPHTTIYVSSCYYLCVLILLYMCPRTAIYVLICVSSYCCICVLILLYVSSYYGAIVQVSGMCDFDGGWLMLKVLPVSARRMQTHADVC